MKRIIPFLIAALSLSSCLKEDSWCPRIHVSFAMEDEYLEGDYDSRIQNDVLLYIFNDEKLVYARNIPYGEIAGGNTYLIDKTPELLGNLRFVAWAVKDGQTLIDDPREALTVHHPDRNPAYIMGSSWDAQYIAHTRHASINGVYSPQHHERYLGTQELPKPVVWEEEKTPVHIIMSPAPGRIKVNIADPGNYLGEDAHVIIDGGMSHMALGAPGNDRSARFGYGTRVNVRKEINMVPALTRAEGDPTTHSTETFGVLPSEDNANLNVSIMNGDELIRTFTINSGTAENFTALHSGDYLIFDYDLDSAEFSININGFVVKNITDPL